MLFFFFFSYLFHLCRRYYTNLPRHVLFILLHRPLVLPPVHPWAGVHPHPGSSFLVPFPLPPPRGAVLASVQIKCYKSHELCGDRIEIKKRKSRNTYLRLLSEGSTSLDEVCWESQISVGGKTEKFIWSPTFGNISRHELDPQPDYQMSLRLQLTQTHLHPFPLWWAVWIFP